MNGQITDEQKKKPWRNWQVPSRTRVRGGTKVSKFQADEALEVEQVMRRLKYGRF